MATAKTRFATLRLDGDSIAQTSKKRVKHLSSGVLAPRHFGTYSSDLDDIISVMIPSMIWIDATAHTSASSNNDRDENRNDCRDSSHTISFRDCVAGSNTASPNTH